MADKTIGELTRATNLDDDSLLIAEQQGSAVAVAGSLFKQFVVDAASAQVGAAEQYAKDAADSAQEAKDAVSQIGTAVQDTKENAEAAEKARDAIENMIVEADTLASGDPATVTKDIVNDVVRLVFGLPAGTKGDKGDPGKSIQSITRTAGNGAPGTVDTYTITLTDGSTSTFNVYNGADGSGAGDMTAAVYDPQGKKTDIYKYVDDALAGVDPDVTADEVEFTDGENLQQKYDNGDLSGEDGITPHIGENGNWFIGTVDTGVQAAGQTVTSIKTVTLLASGWSSLSQTVACAGILADETKQVITVFPSLASRDEYMESGVICTGSGANTLTFTADVAPAADLVVYVAIEEAGQAPLEVYSTEETVVGTWVDGKPIYRKVFVFTLSQANTATTIANLAPLNIDDLTLAFGVTQAHSSVSTSKIIHGIPNSANELTTFWISGGSSLGVMTSSPQRVGCKNTIVLEYTKTTDTATIAIPSAAAMMAAYEEGVNEA